MEISDELVHEVFGLVDLHPKQWKRDHRLVNGSTRELTSRSAKISEIQRERQEFTWAEVYWRARECLDESVLSSEVVLERICVVVDWRRDRLCSGFETVLSTPPESRPTKGSSTEVIHTRKGSDRNVTNP